MARKKTTYKDTFDLHARNRGEEFNEPRSNLNYSYRPEDTYSDRDQVRAPRRHEIRDDYDTMYRLEQRRSQRAFARVSDMENEFYAGVDPRRRQEIADGGMIREDHNAMANLPRQAIQCEYPQSHYYASPYIDDSIRGTNDVRGGSQKDWRCTRRASDRRSGKTA